jgi:D-alanine-D-alanine ligase
MTRRFNHVAVLMGGWSAEREVSLNSGEACAKALEACGYTVTRVDVARDIAERLTALKPDACFNALHGKWGEDGGAQGLLETLAIPYTHSGILASALAMNKEKAKLAFRDVGIPVAESVVANRMDAAREHLLPPPYVIKPVDEGSSVGVYIVREDHTHPPQELTRADWPYGDMVMIEKFVGGRELTCAVKGDEPLGVIEILPAEGLTFYDYEAKYAVGGSRHILPAEISPDVYTFIQNMTLEAHRALGCRGVSRADFRLDDRAGGSGDLVCLEVNTQPGMTATSLVPDMAVHAGMGFQELVRWIMEDASCNR